VASAIYKPQTYKGPVVLVPSSEPLGTVTVTTSDGRTIVGKYLNTNEGRHQYVFPKEITALKDLKISYNGKTGAIPDGAKALEGSGPADWKPRPGGKGDIGDAGSTGFGDLGGASLVAGFGVAPQFIGDQFPKAAQSKYTPIAGAAKDYQFIDPIKFGKEFNPYQREQIGTNFKQAEGFALDQLNTELTGLTNFVPKSAALRRDQTALDNVFNTQQATEDNNFNRSQVALNNPFNQAQRTAQLQTVVPDVLRDQDQQAADARAYASGEVPNSVINNALSIGTSSSAADIATTSGFGAGSSAGQKLSNLMNAKERIQLSQYGNTLLSQSQQDRVNLRLAPTEYNQAQRANSQQSTVGGQIQVNPTLSASQLQAGNFSELNSQINLSANSVYQNAIQQSQFFSGLQQQTAEFNASNTLQNDQFNTTNLNNFALSYFNYLSSYVNSVAGAATTGVNTQIAIEDRNTATDIAADNKENTQENNNDGAVGQITGFAGGLVTGGIVVSDSRLKENVSEYTTGLDDINKLDTVNYTYIRKTVADDGGRHHIGVMAQELMKVFPHSVGKHESGYYQIDPSELIYALLSAVKTLDAKVKLLEAR